MDQFNLNDFLNVLCLKNQLIEVPIEKLLEVYSDYENYITFLDSLYVLSETDSAFLLFSDEFIKKIKEIISENRFKYNDSEINSVVNSIILYLNTINDYSESYKNILKNGYLSYQEDCRKLEFDNDEIFLDALSYDAVVCAKLLDGGFLELDSDALILSSINYLIEVASEFFKDENVVALVNEKLSIISKKGWPLNRSNRVYSRETKEALDKIMVKK